VKKWKIFIIGLLVVGLLASCSFNSEVEGVKSNASLFLERNELLALQHLKESHEVTPEDLQKQVGLFLVNNAASRSANSPVSSISGVQKFTSVIENGFSSSTSNSRSADTVQEASEIPFYVFDITNPIEGTTGYALTCGDARLPGVFAVVEDGEPFDFENPFTDIFYSNLVGYMLETIDMYNSVTDEDIAAAQEKENLINQQRGTTTTSGGITTYLAHNVSLTAKTNWGQRSPYWDVVNSIKGKTGDQRVVTGCVATALAQIMAYHKFPIKPAANIYGKTSFLDPYTNTIKNFSSVSYEWDKMTSIPDIYYLANTTTDNLYKMEVGLLMHEIGINVKMSYGASCSEAYDSNVPDGINKMGYIKPSLVSYDLAKIKTSIETFKPVYTSGYAIRTTYYEWYDIFHVTPKYVHSEGHAWVIDNYQTQTAGSQKREYVHCDLGWNGSANGWYYTGIFDTVTGPVFRGTEGSSYYYKYKHRIIPDITPN